jgi:hypothetical protein
VSVKIGQDQFLVKHYQETLGAIQLRGQRMYLDDIAAQKLIYQYFKA